MTKSNANRLSFPGVRRRKIEASFTGGAISSDGGLVLLREVERQSKLLSQVAARLPDARRRKSVVHTIERMLKQRVMGLAAGYEDLNDHDTLRHEILFQTVSGSDAPLASPSSLCRFEHAMQERAAWVVHEALVEHFIASFAKAPKELVFDFDATDDLVHGNQEGRFFHGYYDHYCFLPLYVFCGSQLLVAYLRPSNIDGAKHAWPILSLLVKRIRKQWPKVRIVVRADSGFCRWKMLKWCEQKNVGYVIGIARNARLEALARPFLQQAADQAQESGRGRLFADLVYGAKSWDQSCRVVLKAEHLAKGANPRFVVTNLPGDAQDLYENLYCARGDMENRIKEQQLGLFADRTSAHKWWPNQWRVLESALAYVLVDTLRRTALATTEMARAQVTTIRLKLLKIGTVIIRNTRRIRLLLSEQYPYQKLFRHVALKLSG